MEQYIIVYFLKIPKNSTIKMKGVINIEYA